MFVFAFYINTKRLYHPLGKLLACYVLLALVVLVALSLLAYLKLLPTNKVVW